MKKSAVLFLTFLTLGFSFWSLRVGGFSNNTSVIYIDPGHGGFDGGAVSKDKQLVEKDLTLNIAFKVQNYLEQMGYKVLLTRDKDKALASNKSNDIYTRVSTINNSNCLLYISIHANSYPHESIKGAQTFYNGNDKENKLLAEAIMDMFKIIDPYNNRIAKSITDKYLIDNTKKTGCLVEVGFLSNTLEQQKLKTNSYQEQIAYAIYLGIMKYLGSDYETRK